MYKIYPTFLLGRIAERRQPPGPLLTALLLSTALLGGSVAYAQTPGGIATLPSAWYKPDGATTTAWTDVSGNSLNLSASGTSTLTVNAGDAAHNFNPWTSGYSTTRYYLYTSDTNAVFGVWGDTAGGYRYTPLTVFGAARATTAGNGAITGLDNDVSYGAEPGFGVRVSGGTLHPRSYRYGNLYDATAASLDIPLAQTSVYLYQPPPGGPSAGTGNLIFGLNGTQSLTTGVSARSSVAGPHLNIGYDAWAFGAFPGDIQEVIWYKATLGANDISKVETYLAFKYGTTLTHDYVNNNGTLYDLAANSGYTANIAGIVRDDASGLYQKQSNSVNTGKQVLISVPGLANTNAANTGTLADGQGLVWGDNGLAKMPSVPYTTVPGANYRFASIWKVQNTAAVGTVRIAWPAGLNSLKLVQNSDPAFATGNAVTDMSANTQTINGVVYNYADVTLANGQYFTFAAYVQSPGGVPTAAWYRADAPGTLFADAGVTPAGDSTALYQWNEYTGNGYDLSQTTANLRPLFSNTKTLVNFNPTVTFNNNYMGVQPGTGQNIIDRTDGTLYAAGYTNTLTNCGFFGFDESNDYPGLHVYGSQYNLLFFTGGPGYQGVSANAFTNNAYFIAGGSWQNGGGATAAYAAASVSLNGNRTDYSGTQLQNAVLDNNARDIRIGWDNNYGTSLNGQLNELMVFEHKLTSDQMDQVESYMAIKYGTTYANGTRNYRNSTGDTVWTAAVNGSYKNSIAGIARDDNGALYQKQSWSVNAGKQVLIGTTGLANTNAANSGSLADGQYLIWGDNGLAKSPAVPVAGIPGVNYRFGAAWKVQNTGSVGTVRVAWPKSFATMKLVQSTDTTFDATDVATNMSDTQVVNGITYVYADVTLANGQYFTFAASVLSPGGIVSLPAVWYRPDNASASKWKDASINALHLTSENGATVRNGDQAHNFHRWTTAYSSTKYYNYLDSTVTNTDLEVNPVFGNFNSNSYSYMPLTVFGVARDTLTTGGSGLITGIDNEKANASEPGFGVYGAQQRFYRFSYGAGISGGTAPIDMSAVYMWRPTTGGATASGTDTLLMGLNGAYSRSMMNKVGSVVGPYLKIGYSASDWGAFPGDIQEVIWYKDSLGYNDIRKVETYLALKYGTTLAHSYVAASGATIYDRVADSVYSNNIAGIGREDANGGLDQRQSNSVNIGDQVLISTTGLSNSNDSNSVQLTNAQYLVWGDNGQAKSPVVYTTALASQGVNMVFKATWKVRNTGSVGTVRVAWPAGINHLSLVQSADAVFDASDVVTDMTVNTQTINGKTYNYADVVLGDGQYFTFASRVDHAPGGVFSGLSHWYRADKDAVNTGDSTNATSWKDYAAGTVVSQMGTNPYPYYRSGSATYLNFNPGINFTDGNQSLGNLLTQAVTDTAYDIFTLTKEGVTAGGANARVFSVLANKSLPAGNIHYWDGIGINFDGRLERYNSTSGLAYLANPGNINFPANSPGIMYHTFTNNTVAKGLNGAPKGTSSVSGPYGMIDGGFTFGSTVFSGNGSDNYSISGSLGETIIYGANNLTPAERNKVDAYLAIKYGVTLDTSRSYLSSGSVVVWDNIADKAYYNNVAGIARDTVSDLHQKQSRSQVTNNTNGQVAIGLGNIYATNNANTATLQEGQFMLWGDNGNTQAMTNTASTYTTFAYNGNSNNRRMNRIWKVRNTNVAQTVKLQFPVASVGSTTITGEDACANYAILYASDAAFTTDLVVAPLTTNGSNYEALNNFPQGASYFTFAKVSSLAPGVVVLPGATTVAPTFTTCATNTWKYARQAASTNKYLAISGMTDVQLAKLSATITPNGATYSNAGQSTKVMPRIATVTDTTAGTYTGVKVRVYYDPSELAGTAVTNAQTNGWFKYEGDAATLITDINTDGVFNTGMASQLTPTASGVENGVAYVEFSNVAHFSSFAYLSSTQPVGTVLPVTLVSFDAYRSGSKVALAWRTASEQRNKGFGIERSADGQRWNTIGFIQSKAPDGNSREELSYQSYDETPLDGLNYYRLKQTDLDGKYTYSQIRQVRISKGSSIDIYPNPVKTYLTIGGLAGNETISVYDATGRKVKTIAAGDHALTIDCTAMAAGVYQVHIVSATGETVSRKIVKIAGF